MCKLQMELWSCGVGGEPSLYIKRDWTVGWISRWWRLEITVGGKAVAEEPLELKKPTVRSTISNNLAGFKPISNINMVFQITVWLWKRFYWNSVLLLLVFYFIYVFIGLCNRSYIVSITKLLVFIYVGK